MTGEGPRPAANHGRFIGRVGALAVFLGVGAALAIPAANAETDGSAPKSPSESPASEVSPGPSSLSRSAADESAEDPESDIGDDSDGYDDTDLADTDLADDIDDIDDQSTPDGEPDEDGALAESPEDLADEAAIADNATGDDSTSPAPDSGPGTHAIIPADDQPVTVESDAVTATSVVEAPEVATFAPSDADEPPPAPGASPADWALVGYARRQIGATADAAAEVDGQPTAAVSSVDIDDTALTNQVSPLGTPQQIAREQLAMSTANSLPVTLMKFVLRLGFLAAGREQFALVGGPDAANLAALDDAVDEYALAAGFQQQILNPMDPAVVSQVAPPHSWYGIDVGGSRLLYDNPDTIYRFIPVNKTSEYVITGRIYDGIPADTTFSVLEGTAGTTSTILSLQDLDVNEDGSFVITVSGEPAAPGQTNHLQLTSGSTLIAARNTLGDWNTEDPMELAVHRVAGPPNSLFAQLGGFVLLGGLVNDSPFLTSLVSLIPPLRIAESRPVRGTLAALLLLVRGANEQAKYMALATTDADTGELRAPNTMTQPASNAEFLANQLQSNGYFQLADDEALVLTIDPGNAGFFTVPVYNDWTITDDYWNQQTSLNNDQAIANPNGTYTMVVSVADPGVANWISTGGLNQGIISMRFQNLDLDSTDMPTVKAVVVKLEDLDDELPAGTVYVTPEERALQLAARKAGYDRRWAPYPQA
ncbi:hypothetical protein JDV09_17745 [Mycobacterium sp. Y57]|uniref:hypothetical protein n=1 Tax=Mycolicibacterium xanthum TaxID=2796469 RepID=UPI001C860E33|nr:hypothetical protein [Mycolicibacterium xanthum]MBX7433939.1 hypothetical protein [Mycolicibacterium xanthum]